MMNTTIMVFVATLIATLSIVQSANILVMLPLPLYSHTINYWPIFKELAARGHNVTMVSPFPQKTPIPNLTDIQVPYLMEEMLGTTPKHPLDMDSIKFKLTGLWDFGILGVKAALEVEQVKRFITDTDSKFDLIMVETWFIQEPFVAFGHKFNAPVINLMPTFLFPAAAHFTGNYLPVTTAPVIHFDFSDRMTFQERVINTFFYVWDIIGAEQYYLKVQDTTMRKYFKYPGSENLPPLTELLRSTSLTLVDQHLAIGYPMPLHKNVVPFGGTNIKRSEKLPQDLQIFMNNAKEGVIYLSFGSHFNLSALRPHMQEAIINALGEVKQKVLIKYETPAMLTKFNAKNIKARSWFPQPSILAHPNCKLFITHGGLHGLMESIYHAVPMVAIPLMADQKMNAKFISSVGIGEIVDITTITSQKLLNAIETVINNPSYQENIQERSAIFKDTPMDTMDNVIYWIEYVIRHKGAPHLRPAVLDLHWYQYLMLDVLAFYVLLIFIILYLIVKIIKLFLNILLNCCRKSKKTKKE